MHSVPLLRLSMTGIIDLVTSTSADNQSFTLAGWGFVFQFQLFQLFF